MEVIKTHEDFSNLKYAEKVYKITVGTMKALRFVGVSPDDGNVFIFCRGLELDFKLVKPSNNKLETWLKGEYKSKDIGQAMIKHQEYRIEMIRKNYINDPNR